MEVTVPEQIRKELDTLSMFAPFVGREHLSSLLGTFGKLIVQPDYAAKSSEYRTLDIRDSVNQYALDMKKQLNLPHLEEQLRNMTPQLIESVTAAKFSLEKAIDNLAGFAEVRNAVNINWKPIYLQLVQPGEHYTMVREQFFDRMGNVDFSQQLLALANKYSDTEIFAGLVYASAMDDTLNYAEVDREEIPQGNKIFLVIAEKLLSGNCSKKCAKQFTRSARNSLIKGCNYMETGAFAGAVLSGKPLGKEYLLWDCARQHIAEDAQFNEMNRWARPDEAEVKA